MTIPSGNIFPVKRDSQDIENYLQQLIYEMQTRDDQIVQGVNGDIRNDRLPQRQKWEPVLKGTAVSGTFTYTHQTGWAFRQGLLVDAWFDVAWTGSGTAAGNLYVELPYEVATTANMPFVGPLQTATIAYGAGQTVLTINAISDTFRGEIWSSGSGNATANIAVAAAGRLIGHIRYIGKRDD